MLSRRTFASLMGAAVSVGGAPASSASAPALDLDAIPLAAHEAAMRLAIAAAKANRFYPFDAVIISAADRTVLAQGVNNSKTNPTMSRAAATRVGLTAFCTPPVNPARCA